MAAGKRQATYAAGEWQGLDFDFTGAGFSGGMISFDSARFSGGEVGFYDAEFSGGAVDFLTAQFSGGEVDFSGVGDWSSPPAFSWGRTGPPARGVKLPKKEDQASGQEQAPTGQ